MPPQHKPSLQRLDQLGPDLLVATADPITFATDALGEYALAVNLNDVATSGGEPHWLLVTLLLPAGQATAETAADLFAQLRQAAERYGVALVGGHTEVTRAMRSWRWGRCRWRGRRSWPASMPRAYGRRVVRKRR